MSPTPPDSAWYQALTLAERIASLRAHPAGPGAVDTERARRRLARWRQKPPLSDDALFARRLKDAGLTEEELLHLLGESTEALRSRVPEAPEWMRDIEDALSRPAPATALPYPDETRGDSHFGLLTAAEPFLWQGFERLEHALRELAAGAAALPFEPERVGAVLFAPLPAQILAMLNRTLVLELNVARLEEKLSGTTPAERFQSFVARLGEPGPRLALYREYPLLARQLVNRVGQWVDTSVELVRRLCADWEDIRRVPFGGTEPGPLRAVRSGMGDVHRGNHSVTALTFASGARLIYKPRSLEADARFQALLEWVNGLGLQAPYAPLRQVVRPGYGWVEYVEVRGCTTEDEVRRFYRRQGGYLALLYVLEGTDFHFENIIAHGEHPLLVDLESLLHPALRVKGLSARGRREAELYESVLRIGMLPQRAWEEQGAAGVDISGMGNPEGKGGRRLAPAVAGAGTDEVTYTRAPGRFRRGLNLPTLNGADVDVLDYQDAFLAGFDELYGLLLTHRDALLGEHGLLRSFADSEVRVLLRPTFVYKAMLLESLHPSLLRDALDRDLFLERLGLHTERYPFLTQVCHAERRAIERGDVPLFTTFPGSRSVWEQPDEEIPEVFDETGLARAERLVARMGEGDRMKQTWTIRASFATLAIDGEDLQLARYTPNESAAPATRARLLASARAVGDRLETLAVREGDECSWSGITLNWDRHWRLAPLGLDLYGGLPGVALFLAHLGELTGEPRYTGLARGAVKTLWRKLEEPRFQPASVGAFLGWAGLIYAHHHLAALWRQSELLELASALVPKLEVLIDGDAFFDVLGGSAGAILVLAALHRDAPDSRALPVARRCGEHLLAHLQRQTTGVGWLSRTEPAAALTGLSHGNAGMALALLELGALTGEERFTQVAHEALAHERSLFSPQQGNWPDLRGDQSTDKFKTSWCHGSTGIGLARLASLRHLDDPTVRGEISAALADTRAQGLGRNHSLCHGDLGALELLLAAREGPGGELSSGDELERWTARVLDGIERHGGLSGVPLGVETPGLMVGLSGVGLQLLRLAEPHRVPSVLTLEPPKGAVRGSPVE